MSNDNERRYYNPQSNTKMMDVEIVPRSIANSIIATVGLSSLRWAEALPLILDQLEAISEAQAQFDCFDDYFNSNPERELGE